MLVSIKLCSQHTNRSVQCMCCERAFKESSCRIRFCRRGPCRCRRRRRRLGPWTTSTATRRRSRPRLACGSSSGACVRRCAQTAGRTHRTRTVSLRCGSAGGQWRRGRLAVYHTERPPPCLRRASRGSVCGSGELFCRRCGSAGGWSSDRSG